MKQEFAEVIGRSCRLPGANNIDEFWNLLEAGQCSISEVQSDRFSTFRYFHPESGKEGKAYTFRAGLIDDVWGFDPAVFAISPREAAQMDPQQRLLLMLVWEALEEAGIPASDLAGTNTGVFVGNSGSDHSNRFFFDPASSDSFMMTGNTTSLVSNRISYIYDLHGPSFTVDTACSSSLVAMDLALKKLQAGEIDLAVVAGVNMLLSPFPFVGFSAASMLSPDGLCKPFDENANGYVRAEGGVVLILQRGATFDPASQTSFGRVVASGTNSDGRTSGVALPSPEFQAELLEKVYGEAGISGDQLAFVEAHGTGTRVGDPAEAFALGEVLGKTRSKPLPIGSVKSNVGHLEPASGMVGVLKALLSLEHDSLPASLHIQAPNPDIPFDDLNLELNRQAADIESSKDIRFAGISNFGFGGTNAHVVVSDSAQIINAKPKRTKAKASENAQLLLLTAKSQDALADLAKATLQGVKAQETVDIADWSNALGRHRVMMEERVGFICDSREAFADELSAFIEDKKSANCVQATAFGGAHNPVFLFSGNGAQFAGMARDAYDKNPAFAKSFEQVDKLFSVHADWSLKEKLFADSLDEDLAKTSMAQPLLFAIQVALVEALRARGIQPGAVIGHSVGEVAASWAAGALSLKQAVKVIYYRSHHQEKLSGTGKMAVIKLSAEEAKEHLQAGGFSDIEISAINAPRSITLSAPTESLEAFVKFARKNRLPAKLLDINYPFHSVTIEPIKDDVIQDLSGLVPSATDIPFFSAVTGQVIKGPNLTGEYWWDNVRNPVHFYEAVSSAIEAEFLNFIEIGPRPILKAYVMETARQQAVTANVIDSLVQKSADMVDPVMHSVAKAIANGFAYTPDAAFEPRKKLKLRLPAYPWQTKPFKISSSREVLDIYDTSSPPHALLGLQFRDGDHIWETELDTNLIPYLKDHVVDGRVILPGAAFAEMAISAAQQVFKTEHVELRDMDLVSAMTLGGEETTSVRTKYHSDSDVVEIYSRKRLVEDEWQLHAKCRVSKIPGEAWKDALLNTSAPVVVENTPKEELDELYAASRSFGLNFGPEFQRLNYCKKIDDEIIEVALVPRQATNSKRESESRGYALHPLDFDASFHGLNILYEEFGDENEKMAFIPVRLGSLRLFRAGVDVRTARLHVIRANSRGIKADIHLFSESGELVASLEDGRFRASALVQRQTIDRLSYHYDSLRLPLPGNAKEFEFAPLIHNAANTKLIHSDRQAIDEGQLLLHTACRRGAYDLLCSLSQGKAVFTPEPLLERTTAASANELDPSDAAAQRAERLKIIHVLLQLCEQARLAEPVDGGWSLASECDLPDMADLLGLVLEEEPRWTAECVMINQAIAHISDMLTRSSALEDRVQKHSELYSSDLYEQSVGYSPLTAAHVAQAQAAFETVIEGWEEQRPLRVLELGVGSGKLTKAILPLISAKAGFLVAADTNKLVTDKLSIQFAQSPHFASVALSGDLDELGTFGPFDLVVSANGMQMLHDPMALLPQLGSVLAPDAALLATISDDNPLQDLVFAPAQNWFEGAVDPAYPISSHGNASDVESWLKETSFDQVITRPFTDKQGNVDLSGAHIVSAVHKTGETSDTVAISGDEAQAAPTIILCEEGANASQFSIALEELLKSNAQPVELVSMPADQQLRSAHFEQIVHNTDDEQIFNIVVAAQRKAANDDVMADLSHRMTFIIDLLKAASDRNVRFWIITPGGYPSDLVQKRDPQQSGIWAFGRTAGNEFSSLDIRLIDFETSLTPDQQVANVSALLREPGDEREIFVEQNSMQVMRVKRGLPDRTPRQSGSKPAEACKLVHPRSGSFDRLKWQPSTRKKPAKGEVEFEVVATGLNFRDVMWAQGLLPEEAMEDGFAGPTVGFECSGRIVAVGEGVERLKVGDAVMALAPACFASHVTVAETGVSKVPDHMDLTGAAAMPVAFLTSYYALHHLGRLEEDEWVLIHGAGGAVGLAALQIAKWMGARVIATAGNEEKRNFLKMLGADHVLDTRSLNFVDEVREITRAADGYGKEGVDVVLNSLFGDAMERSLELVRPFGRFLELGKRDFYGNTKIGLRPFRRNISYFGIDADQLLSQQPKKAKKLFAELTQLFQEETFSLLPYRLFDSEEIVDAFRLMQRSGHIGKIVVKGPDPERWGVKPEQFAPSPEGHHILIGGVGGFGLEAASWLADNGAKSIALTSRTGKISDAAQALIQKKSSLGCSIEVRKCDATDKEALSALLSELRKSAPIRGIMHCAMVLDDALMANLTRDQIDHVLAPKVIGGQNLDQLTRIDPLDYFWLFSSVSVMIGNPGQSHYVAANAYLDGLARQRHAEGLPALSIGWGAISDVGILAREQETAEVLAKTTGGIEFRARDALDRLSECVCDSSLAGQHSTIVIAPMNWSFAAKNLPIMRMPAFGTLAREASQSSGSDNQSIDIAALIDGLDDFEATDEIAKILALEVAGIFRMPVEEVHLNRALADIGMDSLMGMELRTAAHQKLDVEIPIGAIADGMTIRDIASSVLERVRGATGGEDVAFTEDTLIRQHIGSSDEIEIAKEKLANLRKPQAEVKSDSGS